MDPPASYHRVVTSDRQTTFVLALPERYDVACGAYAFALVVSLAATGGYTTGMLLSRAWETLLGGVFGFLAAHVLWPIRPGAARPQ